MCIRDSGRSVVDRFHELPSEKLGQLLDGLSLDELRRLRAGVAAITREAGRIAADTPDSPDSPAPAMTERTTT